MLSSLKEQSPNHPALHHEMVSHAQSLDSTKWKNQACEDIINAVSNLLFEQVMLINNY